MKEQCVMTSPLGTLLLEVDEIGVTMLEFLAESAPVTSPNEIQSPILKEAIQWLTRYFSGQQPITFIAAASSCRNAISTTGVGDVMHDSLR